MVFEVIVVVVDVDVVNVVVQDDEEDQWMKSLFLHQRPNSF
jgi:hypothetical protein